MVRKTAIGSLLPDSSSSNGFSWPFRPTPRLRRMENTAAASVEEMMAPSSTLLRISSPTTAHANMPTSTAVTNTPKVDRMKLGTATGRAMRQLVLRPPENRINARAISPSRLAARALSN